MATLALSVVGAAAGSALLPSGIGILGATISGAVIGQSLGAMAGSLIDQSLFAPSGQSRTVTGPRLSDLKITASTEGAPIPRLYGRARLGGQVIWATPLEEVAVTSGGGGGSGKGSLTSTASSGPTRTDFAYYANFAVALCEGEISGLGRVWANGTELDLTRHVWRLYKGGETQAPDSLISAIEGAGAAPAYRGLAYIVFERMALADFGNRLPQLSFEVHRSVDSFDAAVRGVVMIPGSGEFVYATEPVVRKVGLVRTETENTHTLAGGTDWDVSLDQLGDALPNARSTSLVVSWFGSDLRAANCLIRPAVDTTDKVSLPISWGVAGLTRATAPLVSQQDDRAVYAADWTEYFGHQPADGSGDVFFHLDTLWASASVDAVAIDCYWPLADWRDGDTHLDRQAGARSIHDLAYLKSNLFAGEGYDWYYASTADRDAQVRTPITDGAGKPWVFRTKDVRSWWQNAHYNRPGGIESATATAWVARSKPIWLTEIGCPAVDKGANQPNVFIDPKSSESFLPYHSRGTRDDLMQRRYASAPSDYRQAVAESRRLVGASGRVAQAELAIVMDAEQATAIADTWLFEAWAARDRVSFTLPPSTLGLEPGDVVTLLHAGRSRLLRITAVGEHGARDIEALSIDPAIYASGTDITRSPTPSPEVSTGPALGLFLDLPLFTGNEPPDAGWVAAAKAPWPGGVAFYRSPESSGFTLAATARRPAIIGTTLLALAPGVEARLVRSSTLTVQLDIGTLTSTTPLALLGGANIAALQTPSGAWEVLQFETATLVAPGVYELSRLLRGQAGTEATIIATLPAGSRFVLLDEALTAVPLSRDDIGLALEWRYGPANRDLGDASYVGITHAFAGVGLRPLSPVHVRGQRSAGNLSVTWIRRTRLGGDSWIATEVPLAEDAERWEVDVLSGTTVVRTLTATTPSVVYTAADQTTDFGSPQSAIAIRIHQLGALGRGTPRSAIV